MATVSHYDIRRVVDIYGAVQDRAWSWRDVAGSWSEPEAPAAGSFLTVRGQIETMRTDYVGLLAAGLRHRARLPADRVNFQSWLDPFIIVTRCRPRCRVVVCLFLTGPPSAFPP